MSIAIGNTVRLPFTIGQTDLLAGTSAELIAPFDGFVSELDTTVQVAVTTGGAVTVKNNAGTTVAGISNTVADGATKGTRANSKATAGSSTRIVSKGDRIQVVPSAAFDTAGVVSGFVTFSTGK